MAAAISLVLMMLAPPPAGATMPSITGVLPQPVADAFSSGLFALPEHASVPRTSAVQSRWNIPVIMVGFSDAPLTRTAAEFETALFDTTHAMATGSVYDYYQWVSGGRLRIQGRVVDVINLPNPRTYYAYNSYGLTRESTPENLYGMTRDALLKANPAIDWSEFDVDHDGWVDMLWVIHQGIGGETTADRTNIWSVTSRASAGWRFGAPFITPQLLPGSLTQHYQIDRFTTLPELSTIIPGRRAEIGTYCHEFGHTLGLPDLYDTSGLPAGVVNVGPGNWSLMSTGGYGGSGLTPERPSHLGSWCQLFLGWGTGWWPSEDTLVTLRPIARGDPILEYWYQGEYNPEHFLIENRFREGFDSTLPNSGLIIYHLDDAAIAQRLPGNRVNSGLTPGLVVVEGDGDDDLFYGRNRGDASDPLPGATGKTSISDVTTPSLRTFAGGFTNLALGQIQTIGENVRFQLQLRAPGWQPETPIDGPVGAIYDSDRPGRWARTDAERRVYHARSEVVGVRPQIVLRSRLGGQWQPSEIVSHSPAGALDPAVACLPGGDLAVVWTDLRGSKVRIFVRVRIRGAWQAETPLADLDGDSHHAAIGADASGMIQVAWVQDFQGAHRIYFKRFAYLAPFGAPSPVTAVGESPDPPALEVRPNGSSHLVWTDRSSLPTLYCARFSPDSGVSAHLPVTQLPSGSQFGVTAAIDPSGALHVAWLQVVSGVTELHYQRRRLTQSPSPRDTVLDSGSSLQNPSIASDDSGGVHLTYENWSTQLPAPRYQMWTAAHGWDFASTLISESGAPGILPVALPHSTHDVTMIYTREDGSDLQLVQRTRRLGVSATTGAPLAAAPSLGGWHLGPNPLRAGHTLELAARGDAGRFEVFDLAGRRVATVEGRVDGELVRGEIAPSVTASWSRGMYFARFSGERESRRFVVLH